MRSDNCGRKLETIDQEPAHVVRRVINWPQYFEPAFLSKPALGGIEQRRRDIRIVDAIELAKAADVGLMNGIIIWIVTGHNSTDHFAILSGEE